MVITSTIAALPIITPSMVRKAFTLSTPSAPSASRMLSPQCIIRKASGNSHISEQVVAGVFSHHMQVGRANQLFKTSFFASVCQKVATRRPLPQLAELRVVDKYIWSARRIRSVFEVIVATIEQQGRASGIEEDRGKRVVRVCFHQLSGRRLHEALR